MEPAFHGEQALSAWRLALGLLTLAVLLSLSALLAQAPSFCIDGESVVVTRLLSPARRLPLAELENVGTVVRGILGYTVLEVGFKGGAKIVVPRHYSNFPPFSRYMFSQLGANVESSRRVGATLGRLIRETKKLVPMDATFERFLSKFLEQRNWLVHRSWRSHREFQKNHQEFVDLKYLIKRLSMDAVEFNQFFGKLVLDWARERGVTGSEIEQLAREAEDAWSREA